MHHANSTADDDLAQVVAEAEVPGLEHVPEVAVHLWAKKAEAPIGVRFYCYV